MYCFGRRGLAQKEQSTVCGGCWHRCFCSDCSASTTAPMYWVGYHQAAHTYPIPNWIGFIERLKEQVILRIAWKKIWFHRFHRFQRFLFKPIPCRKFQWRTWFSPLDCRGAPQNGDSFGYTVTCRTCIATLWAMATIGYPIPSPKVGYATKTRWLPDLAEAAFDENLATKMVIGAMKMYGNNGNRIKVMETAT